MPTPVLSSTFLLTLLLMVGLFFFIRASTKDRTETLELELNRPAEELRRELERYFSERAYAQVSLTADDAAVWKGLVRPSVFLAVFLSMLAAVGSLCFALVLAVLFPRYGLGFLLLLLAAPLAGRFYWQRAEREEEVRVAIANSPEGSQLTVIAHRDELAALKQSLVRRQPS